MTVVDARNIYRRDFWSPLGVAHPAIKFQVFDFAVNSGIQTAIRKLQAAVRVADDGHWGPVSSAALVRTLSAILVSATRLEFPGFRGQVDYAAGRMTCAMSSYSIGLT